jgi:hypothetical protein
MANDVNAFGIKEFCRRNGIGRTTAYSEIKNGRLYPRKVGRRTLITLAEEQRWASFGMRLGNTDRRTPSSGGRDE